MYVVSNCEGAVFLALKPVKKEPTLSDKAYLTIRNAIIIGDIAAGDILTEERLSAELSVSRTPLRAALGRLTAEGLLESKGKSMAVTKISKEDVVKISLVRQNIELLGIESLRGNVTDRLIQELYECVHEQRKVPMRNADDYALYIQLDYQFHTMLARATHNQYLLDMVERINMHGSRCLMLSTTLQKSAKAAVDEHESIVISLEKNDIDAAMQAMKKHIQGVKMRKYT